MVPFDVDTSAPAIGWLLLEFVTVPVRSPCGPAVQFGNLNDPIRVCQSATVVCVRYSVVNQKVQASVGSTCIAA